MCNNQKSANLLWSSKCLIRPAIASSGRSSAAGSRGSTSNARLKYSSFRRWKRESTLVVANVISLIVNLAGLGRRCNLLRTVYQYRNIFTWGGRTGCTGNVFGESSGWGKAAWLLTRSRTLGTSRTILPGEVSKKFFSRVAKFACNKFDGDTSRSPILIFGWEESTKGPI